MSGANPIPGRHAGKTVVVTGGSNGIGQAFVERLAAEGAHVLICDRTDGGDSVRLASAAGGTAEWIACDLSDPESIAAFAVEARKRSPAIDALVHAAGIYPMKPIDEIDYPEWRLVFAVNVDSLYHLVRAFMPDMRARNSGRIVAVTTNAFQLGVPNLTHYVASKGAVIGFLRSLAREIGDSGLTVNSIAPTITRTKTVEAGVQGALLEPMSQMQCIKRIAVPQDYAGMLSFLLSEDAALITGQNLVVDGGWTHN